MVDQDSLLVVGLGSLEVVLDNLLVDLMVDISLMEDIALVVDIDLDEVGTGLVVGINLEVDIDPVEDTMVDTVLMVDLDNLEVVHVTSVPIIIMLMLQFKLNEQPTTKLELTMQPSLLAVVLAEQQPNELSSMLELEHFALALLTSAFDFTTAYFAFT